LTLSIILFGLVALTLWFKYSGPRLDARAPESEVPTELALDALTSWLHDSESKQAVIEDADARIVFAQEEAPVRTPLSILHIHGFSACRQETAPIAEHLAHRLQANLVEVRLAGHGLKTDVMQASAEDWLQSVTNGADIAHRLGHQTIILGTSTGAPLGCWAAKALNKQFGRPMAMVYMAPNFGIRQSYAWLLTLPGSEWFLPLLLGRTRSWTPESEAVAKYWSTSYPLQAVIEMQKVVRWFTRQSPRSWTTPMAIMLGDLDPTISAKKALATLAHWPHPASCRLSLPDETTLAEHVFAGEICGPDRTQHCVNSFEQFIRDVMVSDRNETHPGHS